MELNEEALGLVAVGGVVLCMGMCYKLYQSNRALEVRVAHSEQRLTGIEHKVAGIDYKVSALESALKSTQEALSKIYPSFIPQTVPTTQPVMQQPTQYVQVQPYSNGRVPL